MIKLKSTLFFNSVLFELKLLSSFNYLLVFACAALLIAELPVVAFAGFMALLTVLVAVLAALPAALTAFPAALTALPAALTALAAEFIALATVLLALAAVLVVSPPQAMPKALKAKSVESAITFFITNSSLLSSSKNKSNLFLPCTRA